MAFTPEEARQRKNKSQREYAKRTGYAGGAKYNKERGKVINFRLFTPQDDDVLAWLDKQPNKAGYLKALIKADMEKHGNNNSIDKESDNYWSFIK